MNSGVFRLKFESELMSLFISNMAAFSLHQICITFDATTVYGDRQLSVSS
jgi:hypothetical protein